MTFSSINTSHVSHLLHITLNYIPHLQSTTKTIQTLLLSPYYSLPINKMMRCQGSCSDVNFLLVKSIVSLLHMFVVKTLLPIALSEYIYF